MPSGTIEVSVAELPVEIGAGVGRELIRLTHERAGHQTQLILLAAPEAESYYPHIGMEKHRHGGMTFRSIACLPAVVGAWREPGGGLLCFTWDLFDESMNTAAVAGEPNNAGGIENRMLTHPGAGWTDVAGDNPAVGGFICEWEF